MREEELYPQDNGVELTEQELEDLELFVSPEGKLRVDGTVFVGSIQRRNKTSKNKMKNSNVVKTVGYRIHNLETDEWVFMEKMEAIDLVRQLGVVNATIRPRRNDTKDKSGNIVATNFHLNLHPIKGEKPFTDAHRLYPVFKLDRNGKIIKPTELEISEEDCTELMWKVVQEAYKKRKPRGNTKAYQKISTEEKINRIEAAMKAANFQGASNPFEKQD